EPRAEVLLVLLPRLPEVDVQVDEARRDPLARDVDDRRPLREEALGGAGADAHDATVFDDEVAHRVEPTARIEQATTAEDQRATRGAAIARLGHGRRVRDEAVSVNPLARGHRAIGPSLA